MAVFFHNRSNALLKCETATVTTVLGKARRTMSAVHTISYDALNDPGTRSVNSIVAHDASSVRLIRAHRTFPANVEALGGHLGFGPGFPGSEGRRRSSLSLPGEEHELSQRLDPAALPAAHRR